MVPVSKELLNRTKMVPRGPPFGIGSVHVQNAPAIAAPTQLEPRTCAAHCPSRLPFVPIVLQHHETSAIWRGQITDIRAHLCTPACPSSPRCKRSALFRTKVHSNRHSSTSYTFRLTFMATIMVTKRPWTILPQVNMQEVKYITTENNYVTLNLMQY